MDLYESNAVIERVARSWFQRFLFGNFEVTPPKVLTQLKKSGFTI